MVMNLHQTELGWTTYCVQGFKYLSNHHVTEDGLIGERVTPETATHAIVVEVERISDLELKIISVETREL
jgi:hypothetical protein